MGEPTGSEPTDADTEVSRRSSARHRAGLAIAFASLALPFLLVMLRSVTVPLFFKNENSLGWYCFFIFIFSVIHMFIMLIYLIVRLVMPMKDRCSGTVTLVLACLPWIEFISFYIYIRRNGY